MAATEAAIPNGVEVATAEGHSHGSNNNNSNSRRDGTAAVPPAAATLVPVM